MTRLKIGRAGIGTAVAAALAASIIAAAPSRAGAQQAALATPANAVTLSVGTGRLVQLDGVMADVYVANDNVADVQVRSPTQIYIFGKAPGQTTIHATDRAGRVLYSASIRVGNNLASVEELLDLAMPENDIRATPMQGAVLLTGTVRAPSDIEEAQRIVQAFVGEGTQVISRLRTATPMQVMLQVRIAEVSRSLLRNIGVNLQNNDPTGGSTGFVFTRGREVGQTLANGGGFDFTRPTSGSSLGLALSNIFGLDVFGSLDLDENSGLITTLAEPMLSALSGETASFLAGGEYPIPVAQGLGNISIEFKQYGVGLAFTPIVLESGRISMRVRPEVSELSSEGAVRVSGFTVPSLITRRAETTVELGSGQSFMIAGLMRNSGANSVERTPGLGRLPIIGALFRSNGFRRNETELVIVVTPYLVRPVNANQIALPTDGFHNASTMGRVLLDQQHASRAGEQRPGATMAAPQTVAPGVGPAGGALPPPQQPQAPLPAQPARPSAAPGFNF